MLESKWINGRRAESIELDQLPLCFIRQIGREERRRYRGEFEWRRRGKDTEDNNNDEEEGTIDESDSLESERECDLLMAEIIPAIDWSTDVFLYFCFWNLTAVIG